MTNFDETSRRIRLSENEFSHSLSPEPTAVGVVRSAVAVHVASRRWFSCNVQERQTGNIICYDRQEATATDTGASLAASAAGIKAVDELAERILPILAQ